jgi:squalene-hopene/tetraprenyl-beta-curcumene cyclase
MAPALILSTTLLVMGLSASNPHASPTTWNPRGAAAYLDSRTLSWELGGKTDHETFCISCHTALPYAMARPAMRSALGENATSPVERQLLDSVSKRVHLWNEVQPYLGDKNAGLATESVLNALVLSAEDARTGRLKETTRQALRLMWASQTKTGEKAGAWPWVNFGNEPWEAPDSQYWGATLAAAASGIAPEGYLQMPGIQDDLRKLMAYLRNGEKDKSLFNRLSLLWAATKVPGLITPERKAAIISDVLARQQADGGWSGASLIPPTWNRRDGTPQSRSSDGYGTGFTTFVLEEAGLRKTSPNIKKALAWLSHNQDQSTGAWPTVSPNVTRDASTDVGKFMTDSATAYAVLALTRDR